MLDPLNVWKNFRGEGLEEVPEDNLVARDPVIICRVCFGFRRFVGDFVGWLNLQLFRRLGVSSGEQTDEASVADGPKDLCTPSRIVAAGEFVGGWGAQMVGRGSGRGRHGNDGRAGDGEEPI
jgi:hypothetical protein